LGLGLVNSITIRIDYEDYEATMPEKDPNWRPKAIIFDLLTALLDSWTLWDASTPSGSAEEGRLWRGRYLEITFGEGSYVSYEQLVKQAASDVGLPESAPEALIRNWANLQPWPEDAKVLQRLKDKGYKLGVVTNCSKTLGHLAASRPGNADTFDAVTTAEESGFYKPLGQAYKAILDLMGVDASEALFVAGSAGDVQGATKAGMKVVWHNKVGLPPKGEAIPLREGKTLDDALRDFL
jgi:2-haloalkanoic acid dehalogenase type II